jgi:hypothetical protein
MAQIVHYVDNIRDRAGLTPCHSTLTDAVNAAAPSDSIEVFPCVHREAVAVASKDHIAIKARDVSLRAVIAPPSGANNAITVTDSPGLQIVGFILVAPEAAGARVCCGSNGVAIRGNVGVERNFVSGSPADGIRFEVTGGDQPDVVRRNTSAGNAGCDINHTGSSPDLNVWEQNRFISACGAATDWTSGLVPGRQAGTGSPEVTRKPASSPLNGWSTAVATTNVDRARAGPPDALHPSGPEGSVSHNARRISPRPVCPVFACSR